MKLYGVPEHRPDAGLAVRIALVLLLFAPAAGTAAAAPAEDPWSRPLAEFRTFPPVTVRDYVDAYRESAVGYMGVKRFKTGDDVRKHFDSYLEDYALRRTADAVVRDKDPRLTSVTAWLVREELATKLRKHLAATLKTQAPESLLPPREKFTPYVLNVISMDNVDELSAVLAAVRSGADYEVYADSAGNRARGRRRFTYKRGDGYFDFAEEDAIFSLRKGEVSGILRTGAGPMIVKVEEIKEPDESFVREVRQSVRSAYETDVFRRFFEGMRRNIETERMADSDFYALVKRFVNGEYVENREVARVGEFRIYFFMLVDQGATVLRTIDYNPGAYYYGFREILNDASAAMAHAAVARKIGLDVEPERKREQRRVAKIVLFLTDRLEKEFARVKEQDVRKTFEAHRAEFVKPPKMTVYRAAFEDAEAARRCGEELTAGKDRNAVFSRYADRIRGPIPAAVEIRPGDAERGALFEAVVARGVRNANRYVVLEEGGLHELVYVDHIVAGQSFTYDAIRGYAKRMHFERNRAKAVEAIRKDALKKAGAKIDRDLLDKTADSLVRGTTH